VVHLRGVLSAAEQRLIECHGDAGVRGADLVRQFRSHLVLMGRPVLEALVARATGTATVNLHHDISTATGEELIVLTLASAPDCRPCRTRK
jgi:uncharacterized protein YbcI